MPSYYAVSIYLTAVLAPSFFVSPSSPAPVFKLRFQLDSSKKPKKKKLNLFFKKIFNKTSCPGDRTRLFKTTNIDQRDSCRYPMNPRSIFFVWKLLPGAQSSQLLNDSLLFRVPLHIKFIFNNFGNIFSNWQSTLIADFSTKKNKKENHKAANGYVDRYGTRKKKT